MGPGTACDHIVLDYDARHRRRYRYIADHGTDFVLDLPRAVLLRHGDGLRCPMGVWCWFRPCPRR
jgi:urease accessory protein